MCISDAASTMFITLSVVFTWWIQPNIHCLSMYPLCCIRLFLLRLTLESDILTIVDSWNFHRFWSFVKKKQRENLVCSPWDACPFSCRWRWASRSCMLQFSQLWLQRCTQLNVCWRGFLSRSSRFSWSSSSWKFCRNFLMICDSLLSSLCHITLATCLCLVSRSTHHSQTRSCIQNL